MVEVVSACYCAEPTEECELEESTLPEFILAFYLRTCAL